VTSDRRKTEVVRDIMGSLDGRCQSVCEAICWFRALFYMGFTRGCLDGGSAPLTEEQNVARREGEAAFLAHPGLARTFRAEYPQVVGFPAHAGLFRNPTQESWWLGQAIRQGYDAGKAAA
jgi:hypothetical protein